MNLAAHFRRRIASGTWIPELDGLRFIAIASVILFHLQGQLHHHYPGLLVGTRYIYLDSTFGVGNRGVQLFFIISGFILARPFAQHHLFGNPAPKLGKYFKRRLTRLETPLILNLIVLAFGVFILEHKHLGEVLQHFLASIVYMHYAIFRHYSTINPATWSLEVEVQFYILAPLLCWLFAIKPAIVRRIISTTLIVGSVYLKHGLHLTEFTLAGELQYFLTGLLFADLYFTHMLHWRPNYTWDIISLIGWPLLFLPSLRYVDLILPFGALILFIAAFRGVLVPRILANRWIAVTGGACYTIYLWHAPVIAATERLIDHIPALGFQDYAALFFIHGTIKLIAIAIVSALLFIFIERPCMDPDWPHKLKAFVCGPRKSKLIVDEGNQTPCQ